MGNEGVDRFFKAIYKYFPIVSRGTSKISGIIYATLETILSSIGSLIILILALAVEIHRFSLAIKTFEEVENFVYLSAIMLVISLLFIETLIARSDFYSKKNGTWVEEEKHKFSLRYLWLDFRYFLGLNSDNYTFNPRKLAPSLKMRSLRNVIIFGTILLATVGSLDTQITQSSFQIINEETVKVVWYEGLIKLVTESDLQTFTTVLVTIVFTYISVLVASTTSHQVVIRALESLHSLEDENKVAKETAIKKAVMLIKDLAINHGKTYAAIMKRPKIDEQNDMINLEIFDFYDSKRGVWVGDGNGFGNMLNLYKKIDSVLEGR